MANDSDSKNSERPMHIVAHNTDDEGRPAFVQDNVGQSGTLTFKNALHEMAFNPEVRVFIDHGSNQNTTSQTVLIRKCLILTTLSGDEIRDMLNQLFGIDTRPTIIITEMKQCVAPDPK
jgi:hypothetical protein